MTNETELGCVYWLLSFRVHEIPRLLDVGNTICSHNTLLAVLMGLISKQSGGSGMITGVEQRVVTNSPLSEHQMLTLSHGSTQLLAGMIRSLVCRSMLLPLIVHHWYAICPFHRSMMTDAMSVSGV